MIRPIRVPRFSLRLSNGSEMTVELQAGGESYRAEWPEVAGISHAIMPTNNYRVAIESADRLATAVEQALDAVQEARQTLFLEVRSLKGGAA